MSRAFFQFLFCVCVHSSRIYSGVSYAADFLSLCVMVHLLWPSRTYLYFNLDRYETRVNLDAIDFPGVDPFTNSDNERLTAASDFIHDVVDSDSLGAGVELVPESVLYSTGRLTD
jgi:hypothetical protein